MTKDVTRYEILDRNGSDENVSGHPREDGEWVRYDDIKHLLQPEPSVTLTEMSFTAREDEPIQGTAQFKGDAVKEWAVSMVQWFREKGGINYVACDLSDPTTGERFEITMQKAGGRTPAQDLAEMRAALNRAEPPAGDPEIEALCARLKSGEYDGADIMKAWIALRALNRGAST
jgi:hypothetical protein